MMIKPLPLSTKYAVAFGRLVACFIGTLLDGRAQMTAGPTELARPGTFPEDCIPQATPRNTPCHKQISKQMPSIWCTTLFAFHEVKVLFSLREQNI